MWPLQDSRILVGREVGMTTIQVKLGGLPRPLHHLWRGVLEERRGYAKGGPPEWHPLDTWEEVEVWASL